MPSRRFTATRNRRRAFTLAELLIASAATALVSAAGLGLVVAVADTAAKPASANYAGHATAGRLTKLVHEARLATVDSSARLLLWVGDANGDDQIQFSETGMVWRDAGSRELRLTRPQPSADTTLTAAQFLSANAMAAQILAANPAKITALIGGATQFTARMNDTVTSPLLVDMSFTLAISGSAVYSIAAAPAAPAEYLLDATRYTDDGVTTNRKRRVSTKIWVVPVG